MPNVEEKIVSNIAVYLDGTSQNIPAYLYAKQYDAYSRFIKVKLMTSAGQYFPTNESRLNIQKPSGARIYTIGVQNPDGTIVFELTANMLTEVGNLLCDISVVGSESDQANILTSSVFYIVVDKSIYDADAIEGSDEIETIEGIIKRENGHLLTAVRGVDYGMYTKPEGGIPVSDLAEEVKNKLIARDAGGYFILF